jgi:aminomethyltransferase
LSPSADSPPLRRTPLYDLHVARGAKMVPFAGYEMPVQYPTGIIAEHLHTRAKAGLFDVSHMGQIRLRGAAAAQALEGLVPGDLQALGPRRMRYTLFLNDSGGILDDLMVCRLDDGLMLVVNAACKAADLAHLQAKLDPVVTVEALFERALLALQGPAAAAVLARLAPGVGTMPFMSAAEIAVAGIACSVTRSGYTGEDGFEISVRAEDVAALADALCAQPEVKPIGLGARDSLRLEAGLPLYGHDLTPVTDPVSAGLEFAISKARRQSGGFPGAERILQLVEAGAPTRRVGLSLEGRMAAREGAEVFVGDEQVGTVTSGGFSPTLGHPIAMAYVEVTHSSEGTELELEVRGKRLPARVVPMPFVPHRYHRKGAP